VRNCAVCRYAAWLDEKQMHCALRGLPVARVFVCKRFEYEPGAAG